MIWEDNSRLKCNESFQYIRFIYPIWKDLTGLSVKENILFLCGQIEGYENDFLNLDVLSLTYVWDLHLDLKIEALSFIFL